MSSMCWNWEHMKSSLSLEAKGKSAHHRHCLWFYPIILKPLKNVVESDVCWIQTLLTAASPTFPGDLGYLCQYLATVTMQNCFDGTKKKTRKQGECISSRQMLTSSGSVRCNGSLTWQTLQSRRFQLWGAPMKASSTGGWEGRQQGLTPATVSPRPTVPLRTVKGFRSSTFRIYCNFQVILEKVFILNVLVIRTSVCGSDFVPTFGSWILTWPVMTAFPLESKLQPEALSSKNSHR